MASCINRTRIVIGQSSGWASLEGRFDAAVTQSRDATNCEGMQQGAYQICTLVAFARPKRCVSDIISLIDARFLGMPCYTTRCWFVSQTVPQQHILCG
jgi:hypothetical protein